ncbi:uncharacterized protein LOC128225242 [Mya arenaria]|uniref:uncharacterized protein LOC128225242 n=1 Tax=Mya arenaria TaxID=6604 RepID=UPI0022E8EF66|nr:uncharacterized protein LOC128225242 [Mya arenaria]
MELMQADELDLYSGMFPAETEQEEIVCGCRGRGRRVKKAPRLPLIAMVMRMELNEEKYNRPGRGRGRALRDHAVQQGKLRRPHTHMAHDTTHDISQQASYEGQGKTEGQGKMEGQGKNEEAFADHHDFPTLQQAATRSKATSRSSATSTQASNQLPPKTAFNPHRRNMAGVVDSRDSSLSSRNDETGEVKSKIRKRYFDFAQANQDLLQEFPLTMPTKRILTLTRHNLDKFNAQSSDSESCKSGSVLSVGSNQNVPMYERYPVTLDDIRKSRHHQANHPLPSNQDNLRAENSSINLSKDEQKNTRLENAMDAYLSNETKCDKLPADNTLLQVNDKDDVNSNQTDISNVSNLNGSNFSEEDNNPDPTDHAQSGQDVKFEGSDKQDSDKLFPINTDVNAVIDFDRKVAQAYMTPDQVLANSTKSETESASVARTASEKIGSLEEFSSSAAESDIPCLNKKLESGENSYYALTKPEKIVPKINSTSLSQPVYVEGKETDSELEGFQTVKHKVRRKTPPKAIVAVRPLQQTDTVWRLYGRDVIQVDGLPAVSDVSHLHSLVSGFGIIIDHQVCLENGATAIRFKLCSAESCEFCVQCLDGSDCILPDSNSRISCRHLTV